MPTTALIPAQRTATTDPTPAPRLQMLGLVLAYAEAGQLPGPRQVTLQSNDFGRPPVLTICLPSGDEAIAWCEALGLTWYRHPNGEIYDDLARPIRQIDGWIVMVSSHTEVPQ